MLPRDLSVLAVEEKQKLYLNNVLSWIWEDDMTGWRETKVVFKYWNNCLV